MSLFRKSHAAPTKAVLRTSAHIFREWDTQQEELYQAEQARLARRRFWRVTITMAIPVILFWVGFFVVKVLPRLHRLDWGAALFIFPPGMR